MTATHAVRSADSKYNATRYCSACLSCSLARLLAGLLQRSRLKVKLSIPASVYQQSVRQSIDLSTDATRCCRLRAAGLRCRMSQPMFVFLISTHPSLTFLTGFMENPGSSPGGMRSLTFATCRYRPTSDPGQATDSFSSVF